MLGGLNKRMPITGITFILGGSAACALPPLNGFASKWCLYQSLLRSSSTMPHIFDRAICLGMIGVFSAIGALTVACFAKAIGVAFLGRPRSNQAKNAHEVPVSMFMPQIFLATMCLIMGFCSPWLVRPLAPILQALSPNMPSNVFTSIPLWGMGVVFAGSLLTIHILVLHTKPVSSKTWDCGFGKSSSKSQVTADSFAQPIARIFTPILQYHLTVDISGQDRRHFPEKIVVKPDMVSLLEAKIYGPSVHLINKLSMQVAKLQAGSVHLYLAYICIALVVLIVLGPSL